MSAKPRIRVKAQSVQIRDGGRLGVVVPFKMETLPSVYQAIASILEHVEAGEVDGIAIAVTYHSGGSGSCWGPGPNRMTLLGEMQALTHRLASEIHADRLRNS